MKEEEDTRKRLNWLKNQIEYDTTPEEMLELIEKAFEDKK